MKNILRLLFVFILFNCLCLNTLADSKYLSYTSRTDNFKIKRVDKKYRKRIINVSNISVIPLKLVWSQNYNDISAQEVYDNTYYSTTVGSQCVAFIGGLTIIGIPFAVHGATEMVKHKNALLLEDINRYVLDGTLKWEYIVKPDETIKLHLIEKKNQSNPAYIKLRFVSLDGDILEEIDCL